MAKLHEIDELDELQKASFANALWARTDPDSHLPADTWFFTHAFLVLPEPKAGIAKECVRAYLLGREIPRYVQRTTKEDGKVSKSYPMHAGPNPYVRAWIESSLQPICEDQNRTALIDWTQTEVVHLLEKSLRWWKEESGEMDETSTHGWFDVNEQIRLQFDDLVEVLGKVILPKLRGASPEIIANALGLLSELKARGFCVLSALPATLFVELNHERVTQQFREGLNSLDEVEVRETVFGLYNWFAYSRHGQIAMPPLDLLNEVINRIAYRRQPALLNAMAQMSLFVLNFPDQLTEERRKQLYVGLDYLVTDTSLPTDTQEIRLVESSATIPVAERAHHRQWAAALAFRLYMDCQTRNVPIPDVLMKWREICAKESIPELRRAWSSEGNSDS